VRLRVRPGDRASVTVTKESASTGALGAWRLTDREGHFVATRVPRVLGLGETVTVPAGTDLLVEFDPGTVFPGSSLSSGDPIEIDLSVQVRDDIESVPVRLTVADTHRGWYVGFAGH